ncbi:MAG: aminopeptidase P family protein [Lachnospiraceae bacterium]|nr:aminopeptidase P family protein [Lachnospiraceae bacterium]
MTEFKNHYVPEETIIEEKRVSEELRGYVRARISKMRDAMIRKNVDAAILLRPENIFYFSNFNPILISTTPYFVITRNDAFLLVYSLRHDHAVNEGACDKVLCYGKWGSVIPVAMDPYDALRELLGDQPKVLGVEGDYISMNVMKRMKEKLNVSSFSDIAQDAADLRLIKDPHEIRLCRISAELVDLGVGTAIEALEAGASEQECTTEGQYAVRRCWQKKYPELEVSGFSNSETAAMDTIAVWCMSNSRLNYGVDCPTRYVPQPGDVTMPMSWARIGGYNVEIERTVIVSHVNAERQRAYDAMLHARETLFGMIKPGVKFEDLYITAMKIYEDAGFGSILPGRCGHGMGLSTHEYPSVTKGNTRLLEPGMVITVEPGLMSTSLGAIRNSDTIVITEDGFDFLTRYRRDKIIIKAEQ